VIKTVPVSVPKKATFGGGREVKTLVGDLNALLGGEVEAGFDEQQDPDATLMGVIPPEIQAYLAAEGPDIPEPPVADPANSSMVDIPSPLSFTGALDSDDIGSALADAMASVDEPAASMAPPPPPPKAPPPPPASAASSGLDAALMSAMSELDDDMGFTGDLGLTPPPAPQAPQAKPLGQATEYNPVDDVPSGYGTAGPREPPRFSATGSLITDEILNAIDEELDTNSSMPAIKASLPGAANPLATAADFSKLATEAADKERATSPLTTTGPSPYRPGLVVFLMLLLAGTAATAWFTQREAEVEEDIERQNARVARERAIQRARALKLPAPIVVKLQSEPVGAAVFEQKRNVGKTPLDVVFKTKRARSFRLVAEGFQDLRHRIDPKSVTIPEGGGPFVMKVQLKVAAVAPNTPDSKAAQPDSRIEPAPSVTPTPVAPPTPAKASPPATAKPAKPRRRKPKVKKPKPGAIRNPFE
jgi:hypothetical protein